MSGGNGHSSPAVVEATKRVEQCRKRLANVDAELQHLRTRLQEAATAASGAVECLQAAESALGESEPGAERAWQTARATSEQAQAKVHGLQRLIEERERLRVLPEQEFQAASVVLAKAIRTEDIERARRTLATSAHRLNQMEDALLLERQEHSKLKQALFLLEQAERNEQQAENNRIARESFLRANPHARHDNVVTRQGF